MGKEKIVTLTEKDLVKSAAAATTNIIKDIQTQDTYTDVAKTVLSGEISEIGMMLTSYLVALLFGDDTEGENTNE
jgi:hypothetical protein